MGHLSLLETLSLYRDVWVAPGDGHASFDAAEEEAILTRFSAFVAATPGCFERDCPPGHVTGSALVASPELDRVLLTLHGKLGKWLQLGGHADGNPQVHEVAYREVIEESGLAAVRFLPYEPSMRAAQPLSSADPLPIDFDCHDIPARKTEPAHVHYDVRYLVVADPAAPLLISEESKDLRWFTLDEARRVTSERSMLRQFDKLDWLRTRVLH
jgi:8-oxo-dGTP pyrophosphatase MutT (NUDIX family)